MEILHFYSQYIFCFLIYAVNNKHLFTGTLEVHNNDIRSAKTFHLHFTNLAKYEKEGQHVGTKICIHLPYI